MKILKDTRSFLEALEIRERGKWREKGEECRERGGRWRGERGEEGGREREREAKICLT